MALVGLPLSELANFLKQNSEWLIARSHGPSFSVRSSEIEFRDAGNRIEVSFLFEKGRETWDVADFAFEDGELLLEVFDECDGAIDVVRIVPRTRVGELRAEADAVRMVKAHAIARAFAQQGGRARVVRIELNRDKGRFANIVVEFPSGRQVAAVADVTESLTPEFLLATAVVWVEKLRARRKKPIERVAVIAPRKAAVGVQKLRALLSAEWQRRIHVFELEDDGAGSDGERIPIELEPVSIDSLWAARPRSIEPLVPPSASEFAESLLSRAPESIDIVHARNGETVRYNGLPFARIRTIGERQRVWTGVTNRQAIDADGVDAVYSLIEELGDRRRHDASQKRHEYFRLGPEAWLESMLRRNIKLLDPNLILSPVYNQFRAERDKIDLLALRSDGRLVIIEVKVSADREMVYQAADYWRKIESERRSGNLRALELFGALEIADRPAVIYLVAPTLSYHPDFNLLASTLGSDVPICRFDLYENWRKEVKVFRRAEPGSDCGFDEYPTPPGAGYS